MFDETDLQRRQEKARRHPMRAAILRNLSGGRKLPATAICQELPDSPSLSMVAYHLNVLVDAKLVRVGGEFPARVFSLS